MQSLIFRGAEFRHSQQIAPKEGPGFVRAHFRSDLTDAIREEFGWDELPPCVASPVQLPGELAASSLTLTPTDGALVQYQRCLQIDAVEDFRALPLKDEQGEVTGHCLECRVKLSNPDSIFALSAVALAIGRAVCRLDVSLEARQQMELVAYDAEPVEPDSEDRQITLAACTIEPSSEDEKQEAAPLASVTSMPGYQQQAQAKRRGRPPKAPMPDETRPGRRHPRVGPIPTDPGAAEWRTESEIEDGVPHHIIDGEIEMSGGMQ